MVVTTSFLICFPCSRKATDTQGHLWLFSFGSQEIKNHSALVRLWLIFQVDIILSQQTLKAGTLLRREELL
jgi:hypothetical protein